MYVWWILNLADKSAIVAELHLSEYNRGVAAHDVPRPRHMLLEQAIDRQERFLLVVENLKEWEKWVYG